MSIIQCDISNNQAGNGGNLSHPGYSGYRTGNGGKGGGLTNSGTVEIKNSAIGNNETGSGDPAGDGGGIYNAGSFFITKSLISSNVGSGGNCVPTSPFSWGCSRSGFGGGIYNADTLTLINCTISRNKTIVGRYYRGGSGGHGGGIYNAGTVLADNVTIAFNKTGLADEWIDSYYYNAAAGGGISTTGVIQMRNTLITGNLSENAGPDCSGIISSIGYNLVGDISGCTVVITATDIISTPHTFLAPFADNGGDTWTHALMPGSRAIDAGSCLDSKGITVTVDQRGIARPIGVTCDIGAFEAPEYPTFYLSVVMR
jgi:hypothetical protein